MRAEGCREWPAAAESVAITAQLTAVFQELRASGRIEDHLDDSEALRCGVAALKNPADPVLDWAEVRT